MPALQLGETRSPSTPAWVAVAGLAEALLAAPGTAAFLKACFDC